MKGTGPVAELIEQRFQMAIRQYGLDNPPSELDVCKFRLSNSGGVQMSLFDE